MTFKTSISCAFFLWVFTLSLFGQTSPVNTNIHTVFLIGIDGLSVDGLTKANTPNMDMLIKNGASSLKARGVMPTSSGPNWGSMLLGAGPEQHGITSNSWRVDDYGIEATVRDEDGFFPSVFDIIKHVHPQAKLGVIHEWETIKDLFNHKAVDYLKKTSQMNGTLNKAFKYYKEERPKFVFIHLDAVDHAGHEYGHGTNEYYHEIELIDQALGKFFNKLRALNEKEDLGVNVLISSDHGGIGKGHGGSTMEEIIIPWILSGPHIKRGYTIEQSINTYDTPATILKLLDADKHIPMQWIGKPVLEALEKP